MHISNISNKYRHYAQTFFSHINTQISVFCSLTYSLRK